MDGGVFTGLRIGRAGATEGHGESESRDQSVLARLRWMITAPAWKEER